MLLKVNTIAVHDYSTHGYTLNNALQRQTTGG